MYLTESSLEVCAQFSPLFAMIFGYALTYLAKLKPNNPCITRLRDLDDLDGYTKKPL